MKPAIAIKSFEEVYKTAYSHGLENIYALENVDIKTVRPLQGASHTSEEMPKRQIHQTSAHQQQTFNFGLNYKTAMQSFVLKEPIQMLSLTRYLENKLLEQGRKFLRDLLDHSLGNLGYGHVEEIRNKLEEYLDGRQVEKTQEIDFAAWLKSLAGDLDRKKVSVVLEPYQLHTLFPLSSPESLELRRLTLEKRREWQEESNALLRADCKKQQIDSDFCEITEVFMKPWMDMRLGIATELELLERIQKISENPSLASLVLDFFTDTYFKGVFPLNRYLEPLDAGLFASCSWVAEDYDLIVEKALTFFYNPSVSYRLDSLAALLEAGFAKEWVGFRQGFLQKVLKLCPRFYVYKNAKGLLHISLA